MLLCVLLLGACCCCVGRWCCSRLLVLSIVFVLLLLLVGVGGFLLFGLCFVLLGFFLCVCLVGFGLLVGLVGWFASGSRSRLCSLVCDLVGLLQICFLVGVFCVVWFLVGVVGFVCWL